MNGGGYIALAALILLLLPVVVMPWEGRRVPDALYAALAVGGLVAAAAKGGLGAMAWAVAGGCATLAIVAAITTAIRLNHRLQLLTSGHVKLLSAGSLWLGLGGALAMVGAAFAALFIAGILQRRRSRARRPDFAAIAALAILCVGIQQSLSAGAAGVAPAAKASR